MPWRETTDPYRIWLSEIILQQTRVQQGMDYWWRFVERFPKVEDLAAADEAEVMLLWQGLGYYSRARNLHKAAKMIVERGWAPFPTTFEDVLSLPGVGEYTAGAIMSFAYDAPYPAADGNVYRVLSRLMDCDEPFDTTAGKKLFRQFAWDLLDREHPRLHNSAIMELGALFCTPGRPDCPHCPLAAHCKAYEAGTVALLPVRKERPKLRDRWLRYTVYIAPSPEEIPAHFAETQAPLLEENFTLIRRREDKDIWQHLWEFPLQEFPDEASFLAVQSSAHESFPVRDGKKKATDAAYLHVLSHQRLHARFDVVRLSALPEMDGCIAIPWSHLQDYALSRLTLRFLEDFCLNLTLF